MEKYNKIQSINHLFKEEKMKSDDLVIQKELDNINNTVDILLVIDSTERMKAWIKELGHSMSQIINKLHITASQSQYRLGFVSFSHSQKTEQIHFFDFDNNTDEALNKIQNLTYVEANEKGSDVYGALTVGLKMTNVSQTLMVFLLSGGPNDQTSEAYKQGVNKYHVTYKMLASAYKQKVKNVFFTTLQTTDATH